MKEKRKHCALCKMKRSETRVTRKYGYWFCNEFSVVSGITCVEHKDVLVLKEIELLKKQFEILNI